jgi:hypothetical protein
LNLSDAYRTIGNTKPAISLHSVDVGADQLQP